MTLTYFAYGSNMLPARLSARCPSARATGRAEAVGWRLEFWKEGRDGSGKATLIKDRSGSVPGVLFAMDPGDLPALDRAEGAGIGYDRHDDLRVIGEWGERAAISYVALRPRGDLMPFDWYLALVVAGARHARLPDAHVENLRRHRRVADPVPDRPARLAGLAALAAHGWDDIDAVLT